MVTTRGRAEERGRPHRRCWWSDQRAQIDGPEHEATAGVGGDETSRQRPAQPLSIVFEGICVIQKSTDCIYPLDLYATFMIQIVS